MYSLQAAANNKDRIICSSRNPLIYQPQLSFQANQIIVTLGEPPVSLTVPNQPEPPVSYSGRARRRGGGGPVLSCGADPSSGKL